MSRTSRLFEITQYLRNRKKVTAVQLAEWLEVSPRTIYRDMQQLMISGVPINGEAGTGYWLEEGFDFPPLMFSKGELEALYIGMQMTIQCTDKHLAEAALNVLEKVEQQLPTQLSKEFKRSALNMHFPIHSPEIMGHMEIMRKAIHTQNKLSLEYAKETGQHSKRIVRPLELSFWGKSWTLTAWCELRNDFRNFRPDRVLTIKRSQHKFVEEDGKSLEDYHRLVCEAEPDYAPEY